MKTTLIIVCGFAALIAVQRAFAEDKRVLSPRAKDDGWASRFPRAEAKAKPAPPVAVVKDSPPKRPWVGRTVSISESERHVIREYVHNRMNASKGGRFNGVSQGLTKKVTWWPGKLPDGWEKQCVRGKVLPSEVHKHCHSLPDDIILHLPPPPPGTILLAVDGKVVRIGYPTYEILDVFDVHARRVDIKASLALSSSPPSIARNPSVPPAGNVHLARMH